MALLRTIEQRGWAQVRGDDDGLEIDLTGLMIAIESTADQPR
jgi:hypothetical protein